MIDGDDFTAAWDDAESTQARHKEALRWETQQHTTIHSDGNRTEKFISKPMQPPPPLQNPGFYINPAKEPRRDIDVSIAALVAFGSLALVVLVCVIGAVVMAL